jgi:glucose-1-phosphate cytidylyltransferase
MKAIILAGGLGTRLGEITKKIPKPMVPIKKKPILIHIIEYYQSYGVNNFYIATGYKHNYIKNYFKKNKINKHIKVNIINTGLKSLTGTRLLKLKKFFKKNENFFMTYGDAISNVNIKRQLQFHKKSKRVATLLAVHPPARFGELIIKGNRVQDFEEKPQLQKGWINGGFFVLNYKIFNYLNNKKDQMFEREPIRKLTKSNNLAAYKHDSFWMCMDTVRDKMLMEKKIKYFNKL